MMTRKIILLLLLAVVVSYVAGAYAAPPSKLNTCAAWMNTYQQFHPDDKDTSILLSDFEGEMKRLDLFSVDEIENALDLPMMLTAADNSPQTKKDLMYCRGIAQDFVGFQK